MTFDQQTVVDSSSGVDQEVKGRCLVVISHGMWGLVADVGRMAKFLDDRGGPSTSVYVASSNQFLKSYSGIDICGTRLAAEVKGLIGEGGPMDSVRKISMIGYSAGGLFVRYAIGLMYQEGFFTNRSIVLDKVITIATPHLGVRSSPSTWVGRVKNTYIDAMGSIYGGRSMEHMALRDGDGAGPNGGRVPLLLEMALPGTRYDAALRLCRGVYLYANALNDNTVPYATAALAVANPYRVNVCLPGLHTHGTIVFRRSFDGAGSVVLQHVASLLYNGED